MRSEFPALEQQINGNPLVYLDSAATTLKPKAVVEAIDRFNSFETANVHRGAHYLSDQATAKYESARRKVADFIGAQPNEVVFTSGTTDSLNMLAHCLESRLQEGDEVLLTEMEHHSNLVPWQLLAERRGLKLKFIPVDEFGELQLDQLESLITAKTKIASFVYVSNSLGTVNDVEKIIKALKSKGVLSIVDAAQSVSCMPTNVKDLDCDFLVFSGHKLFGPYGIGVCYGKLDLLNDLPPFRGGGSMIENVELQSSTFLDAPQRFEAGTPNISGVIGLGAAIDRVNAWGFEQIEKLEDRLASGLFEVVSSVEGVKIIGKPKQRKNVVSFVADWGHPSDIGQLLDQSGVAVRSGHHCTQPLMKKLNITGTVRASLSVYSNEEDLNRLFEALEKTRNMLK